MHERFDGNLKKLTAVFTVIVLSCTAFWFRSFNIKAYHSQLSVMKGETNVLTSIQVCGNVIDDLSEQRKQSLTNTETTTAQNHISHPFIFGLLSWPMQRCNLSTL